MVSIIIPVYNRADLIPKTLNSVQNQTYQNWECIVVDDRSTDNTKDVIETFCKSDSRFLCFVNNGLKGAQDARNTGMRLAKGEYIIFLDSDDLIASFCIEQRVREMKKNLNLDFLVFPQLIFNNTIGDSTQLINIRTAEPAINRFFTLCYYLDVPWVNGGPIFKRKSLIEKSIVWDPELRGFQDVAFHINCLIAGMKFEYADQYSPDFFYRKHDGDRVGDGIFSNETINSTEKMLINLNEKILENHLLTRELRNRIKRTAFHSIIEKRIGLSQKSETYNSLKKLRTKNVFSFFNYLGILLYIDLRLSFFKRFMDLQNRFFYRLWKNSFFKKETSNYLKHHYPV